MNAYKHVTLYTITNIHNKYHQDNKRFFDKGVADKAWSDVVDKENWRYEWCEKSYPDYSVNGYRSRRNEILTGESGVYYD
jgi:hypothetical protein